MSHCALISETGSILFSFLKIVLISFIFSSLYYLLTLTITKGCCVRVDL